MFDPPPEVLTAAGYALVLCAGVIVYMRFTFSRPASDVSVRMSIARVFTCGGWAATLAVFVWWNELCGYWNYFIFPQIRWLLLVPTGAAIGLIIYAMKSRLYLAEDGQIEATGPYKWSRYPFDAALAIFLFSLTLFCGNWMILAIALFFMMLHRVAVTGNVERVRRKLLGEPYAEYASRTGWFFPGSGTTNNVQYQVPSRFGLTAIMGLLTVLAIIFGILRSVESPPVVYLFVGSEIMAICLAQIVVGSAPRGGSALTGAILLPFWVYITLDRPGMPAEYEIVLFVSLVSFGALMGYCIGALAAGFFLMMDLIEPWLIRDTTAYPLPTAELTAQDGFHEPD